LVFLVDVVSMEAAKPERARKVGIWMDIIRWYGEK
jgi:hypothetical protein